MNDSDSDTQLDIGSLDLSRYFEANHPISDDDRKSLRVALGRAELEMKAIDIKLTLLRERKEILFSFQNVHASLLSRIRSLPTELLAHIFSFCAGKWNYVPPTKVHEVPWNLSQVCRTWRQTALSMGSLWAHISITPRSHFHPLRRLPVLKRSIQHSAGHPLSVQFVGPFDVEGKAGVDMLSLVVDNCHRLAAFEIPVYQTELFPILNRAHGCLNSLWSCSLDCSYLSWPGNTLNAFEVAPHLTKLHLRSPPEVGSTPTLFTLLPMPWGQLRELSLTRAAFSDLRVYLGMTPSLERLTLTSCYDDSDMFDMFEAHTVGQSTRPPLIHTNLRELDIAERGKTFLNISFPCLESYSSFGSGFVSLCNFLLPSQSALRHLHLELYGLEKDDYKENAFHPILSEVAPFLESLSLRFDPEAAGIFEQVLHILTVNEEHNVQVTLPRLESLVLDFWSVGETWPHLNTAFVEMLESRWRHHLERSNSDVPVSPFKVEVAVGGKNVPTFPEMTDINFRRLKILKEQGMRLSIKAWGDFGMFLEVPLFVDG